MLPKNVNWSILAQCDFFAVEKMVQTADRPAMKTIEPLRESIFNENCKTINYGKRHLTLYVGLC